jgi:hypothetical protein
MIGWPSLALAPYVHKRTESMQSIVTVFCWKQRPGPEGACVIIIISIIIIIIIILIIIIVSQASETQISCPINKASEHAGFASKHATEQERVADAGSAVCLVNLLPRCREVDVFENPSRM